MVVAKESILNADDQLPAEDSDKDVDIVFKIEQKCVSLKGLVLLPELVHYVIKQPHAYCRD